MIDINDENYKQTFQTLFNELKSHNDRLVKKPSLILITKLDTIDISELKIARTLKKLKIIPISSISKKGIKDAISSIASLIK